jgi:IMP dehydrogenase
MFNSSKKIVNSDSALTYDDIQLVPQYSEIETRSSINIDVNFGDWNIPVPIFSAPMDSVTGYEMALELGRMGAVGILHRFMSMDEQCDCVRRLRENLSTSSIVAAAVGSKKSDAIRIRELIAAGANFLCIDVAHGHHSMVRDTIRTIQKYEGFGYRNIHIMAGSVCTKEAAADLIKWGADSIRLGIGGGCFVPGTLVKTEFGMKPIEEIEVGERVWTHKGNLQKVLHKFEYDKNEEICVINDKIRCTKNHEFWVATTGSGNWVEAENLRLYQNPNPGEWSNYSLCEIEGNGYNPISIDSVTFEHYEGKVHDLHVENDNSYNVFGVLCHNSVCSSRIMAGVGIPQVTAILDCIEVARKNNIPIIADGGIRYPGDIVKAIGLGASGVMIGNLFAGTDESPGSIKRVGDWGSETLMKTYRGSASLSSKVDRGEKEKNVEGVAMLVPYKGPIENILNSMLDGLRSGMSYVGAKDIPEFQKKARFVKISNSGIIEATPHGLSRRTEKL